jgi:hypothetical protein
MESKTFSVVLARWLPTQSAQCVQGLVDDIAEEPARRTRGNHMKQREPLHAGHAVDDEEHRLAPHINSCRNNSSSS